jgi:sensor histidine kinase YesM
MLKTLNKKYPYSFSLLAVLVLLEINRALDGFAWIAPHPDKTKIVLLNALFEFIAFLPFVFLLIQFYQWAIKKKNNVMFILFIIVFTVLGPSLFLFFNTCLTSIFYSKYSAPFTIELVEKFTPSGISIFLLLSAVFYVTHLKLLNSKQIEMVHRAESLTKEVQLKMLRYQINPHFLFNVLNSIHALIDENTVRAKKLVVEMSEYYRYTLSKQQSTISIREEVEAVMKYLEIQKMRFEEELHYEVSIDETASAVLIPPFVIHLLVENAVKYGIMSNEQQLIIRLSAEYSNRSLIIRVSNSGRLKSAAPQSERNGDGTGTGIENIKSRLALLYGDGYSFSLKEENGWVIATVEIKNIQNI